MGEMTCINCGLSKPISEFSKILKGGKIYYRKRCKRCRGDRDYQSRDHKKQRTYAKKYYKRNRKRILQEGKQKYNKEYYRKRRSSEKSGVKIRERDRRRKKKESADLSICYVKSQIVKGSSLKWYDIPPELVELKTKQLKLYRHVKKQKNHPNH